ncbi:hypothetical protein [Lentzea sp. NPDC059081]|uniref:hypothetical protein n=1 Tax=Lentzea sp. NPDC059081 TaxID=3346719 RepID=UPI0036BDFBF8
MEFPVLAQSLQSLIAVAAALSGSLITAWMQRRASAEQRTAERRRDLDKHFMETVATVAEVIDAHRSAMWTLEEARHGTGGHADEDLVTRSRSTRIAISAPLMTLQIIDPVLGDAAQAAADATYRMYQSLDVEALKACRSDALDAARAFTLAARTCLHATRLRPALPGEGVAYSKSFLGRFFRRRCHHDHVS